MSNFLIIPAIDIMDGACVRLEQGDPGRRRIYSDQPVAVAKQWVAEGARRLHLVDLDGAFSGELKNLKTIMAIREAVTVELELGGGLRTEQSVSRVLDYGIDYAIVGTRAFEDTEFLRHLANRFGKRIILGLDVSADKLATAGWKKRLDLTPAEFLHSVARFEFKTVIHTDTTRDGMLGGTNLNALVDLATTFPGMEFIASGGVATLSDITNLLQLNLSNLIGVIIGKALYEKRISLAEAIKLVTEFQHDSKHHKNNGD